MAWVDGGPTAAFFNRHKNPNPVALRPVNDRLRVLIARIEAWEGDEDEHPQDPAPGLLLDIKQCLESCVRDY